MADLTKQTQKQISNYRRHLEKDETTDRPASGQVDDLMDCVRYLAAHRPKFIPVSQRERAPSAAYTAWQNWLAEEKKNSPDAVHCGPGRAA